MTDPEKPPLDDLLSSFALGPAWARGASASDKKERKPKGEPRTDDRGDGPRKFRDDRRGGRDEDRRGDFRGRGARGDDRRGGPPRHEEAPPEDGVRVTLVPDQEAIRLIAREIHQVARVYPLFDIAKTLLAERKRCRVLFEAPEPHAPLWRGKLDDSLFLTREEAVHHLWQSDLRNEFLEEAVVEMEPPTGNFQVVARCGISGEWLGPPNFHAYQTNLHRLHRERFSHLPFATYLSRVRTERGEEAVNEWLETMKHRTRWRLKGGEEEPWVDDQTSAERVLSARCFDSAFEETRRAEATGDIRAKNLSPSLLTSLKLSSSHARKHPAMLIPAVCRALESEHLPVFKRQGKLFTGPARPHPLPPNAVLAERPSVMVEWIRNNKPAKLEGLWKHLLPEGSTAPPAEYAADLFWLLTQGHILLFSDDTLVVQEVREQAAPAADNKKSKKAKPAAPAITAATTSLEAPAGSEPTAPEPDAAPTAEPATEPVPAAADAAAPVPTPPPAEQPADVPPPEIETHPDLTIPEPQLPPLAEEVLPTPPEAIAEREAHMAQAPEIEETEEMPPKPSSGVDESPAP